MVMCVCVCCLLFFFFFKQTTAYEMLRSLVCSEMCIRDSGRDSSGFSEEVRARDYWHVVMDEPAAYTHLTLPTIYSV